MGEYEKEKRTLNNLARRTRRISGTLVRALKEIKANGTTQVKIPWILNQVKRLIDYSLAKFKESEDIMEKLTINYQEASTQLVKLGAKLTIWKNEAEEYIRKLEQGEE